MRDGPGHALAGRWVQGLQRRRPVLLAQEKAGERRAARAPSAPGSAQCGIRTGSTRDLVAPRETACFDAVIGRNPRRPPSWSTRCLGDFRMCLPHAFDGGIVTAPTTTNGGRHQRNQVSSGDAGGAATVASFGTTLEVIVIPVSDVDRAKEFWLLAQGVEVSEVVHEGIVGAWFHPVARTIASAPRRPSSKAVARSRRTWSASRLTRSSRRDHPVRRHRPGWGGARRALRRRHRGGRSAGCGRRARPPVWSVHVLGVILYLERATFVTGETLHVDGGQAGPPVAPINPHPTGRT